MSRDHFEREERKISAPACPACGAPAEGNPEEVFHDSSRYACSGCDLHFWHPVSMPDAAWHETAYQGRDHTEMPLEPGHRFFLSSIWGVGLAIFLPLRVMRGLKLRGSS
jgi:hypothetical protein